MPATILENLVRLSSKVFNMIPNQRLLDTTGTPFITLNDVQYPVPLFAPKQNRILVPLIKSFINRGIVEKEDFLSGLDAAGYDDLVKIIYTALSAAHDISLRDFEDMPMRTIEMTRAVQIIMQQTGIFLPDDEKKIVPIRA
jgi:hypothetical protein